MKWLSLFLAATVGLAFGPSRIEAIEGPPDTNISALAWDGEGLWVGYFDAGLARFEDGHWTEIGIVGGPAFHWINTLCWDGQTLWVGSGGGLSRWNAEGRGLEQADEVDFEGAIMSVRVDSGVLVVTGGDRIWVRRDDAWQTYEMPGEALHSAFIHRGRLWAAGMRGILERHKGGWRRYSELNGRLPHSWVTSLLTVGDGVWAGTYDAGLVALTDRGQARMIRPEAWVNFNAVVSIRDGVAVGTMGDGLLLWNDNGAWQRLSTQTGLPSDDVTAVVEAAGRLWVGTRGGLAELAR